MKTYEVYVLVNRMNRRFIGVAESAEEDAKAHNSGKFKWTAQFKPWKLEWSSSPMSRRDADRLERKLVPFKTNSQALQNLLDEQDFQQEEEY